VLTKIMIRFDDIKVTDETQENNQQIDNESKLQNMQQIIVPF
jgi:hypothetical protein